jgi:hypothetical protein
MFASVGCGASFKMRTIIYLRSFLMKKTVFALFTVLLVLSLATCELLEPVDTARTAVPDGMVRLTINVDDGGGPNRALTPTLGNNNADHYEVVFVSGTPAVYYQTEWTKGSGGGTITIPTGNYTGAARAILFAGKDNTSEKTLLGVGIITAVNGTALASLTPPNVATISAGTNNVTFTVTSLENAVSANAGTSTFVITAPTAAGGENYATNGPSTMPAAIDKTGGSIQYPVFPVPAFGYAGTITASYTISSIPYVAQVIRTGAWSATAAGLAADGEAAAVGNVNCAVSTPAATGVALTGTNDAFVIDITLGTVGTETNGLAGLLINVPVCAYTTAGNIKRADSTPPYDGAAGDHTTTWTIRGGSSLTTPDGVNGNGAAVLLGIGVHGHGMKQINIPDPTTWD